MLLPVTLSLVVHCTTTIILFVALWKLANRSLMKHANFFSLLVINSTTVLKFVTFVQHNIHFKVCKTGSLSISCDVQISGSQGSVCTAGCMVVVFLPIPVLGFLPVGSSWC